MPFPDSPRVIFDRNPITDVVAQLRFPPVLAITATDPAAFQEGIRAEYPLYQRQGVPADMPPALANIVQQLGGPTPGPAAHIFTTADGYRTIALAQESITLASKNYVRWEDFSAKLGAARAVLEAVYRPAFYVRLSLRYVDRIDRAKLEIPDEPWPNLIQEKLIGPLGDDAVQGDVTDLATTATLRIPDVAGGQVRLRYGLQRATPQAQRGPTQPAYIVDAEFSTSQRSQPNDVGAIMGRFNRVAGNLFRWAITARLRTALRPMDVD